MIAKQLIGRLKDLHSLNIIHQDLKPHNIVIGKGKNKDKIHLIDFGLSMIFKNKIGQHVPKSKHDYFMGTVRYASLNAHR